jgi:acetolactate synthase-1/2/3 large subunit
MQKAAVNNTVDNPGFFMELFPGEIALRDSWKLRGSAGPARHRIPGRRKRLLHLAGVRSMARESADVNVLVCANRRYRILQTELTRAGIAQPGPKALALTDLTRPVIDWLALARGLGVPACRVGTDGEFAGALKRALAERGPSLFEPVIG